jgi:hypothetical protein
LRTTPRDDGAIRIAAEEGEEHLGGLAEGEAPALADAAVRLEDAPPGRGLAVAAVAVVEGELDPIAAVVVELGIVVEGAALDARGACTKDGVFWKALDLLNSQAVVATIPEVGRRRRMGLESFGGVAGARVSGTFRRTRSTSPLGCGAASGRAVASTGRRATGALIRPCSTTTTGRRSARPSR